jgi:hypothetical protein
MNDKRKAVEEYVLKLMMEFDQYGGSNAERYSKLFKSMNDKQFDDFMMSIREKRNQLSVVLQNNNNTLTTEKVVALAKDRGVKIFSKVYMFDPHTNRKYLTKYPMMIITIPVRRLSQYLFHKISLPDGDNHVNPITGQVIPPDKGAALSAIETQILTSKNLTTSIVELIKIRSGDMSAYRSMKYLIEETGEVSIKDLPMTGQPRSTITIGNYFHGLMIDSTF